MSLRGTILQSIALGAVLLTGCQQANEKPAATAAAPATQTAPAAATGETPPAAPTAAETPAAGEQSKEAENGATAAPAPKQ